MQFARLATMQWFDKERALAAVGDDPEILREIAQLFLDDLPRRLQALHEALAKEDCENVAAVAHSLRGSASMFGSLATTEAALRVERFAREKHVAALPSAIAQLEFSIGKLVAALSELVATGENGQ